jgi:hypothetical protein
MQIRLGLQLHPFYASGITNLMTCSVTAQIASEKINLLLLESGQTANKATRAAKQAMFVKSSKRGQRPNTKGTGGI